MDEVLSLDEPYVAGLVGTLRRTTQRLENPEIDIAEIAALANVGARGIVRYAMERIVDNGRATCDATYACETALKENKVLLTELCHALQEHEQKTEWFHEHQEKLRRSNTKIEEKNRELDESIKRKKIGTHDGKVLSLGDGVGLPAPEENWMERILPAGLQHGTRVGWARNQSVAYVREAEAVTSSPISPFGNHTVHTDKTPVVHESPFERSSEVTGLGNLSCLGGPGPSNLSTGDTDTLSPRPLHDIMGEGNPMMEQPVTDPTEHLPDDNDNTLPASK
jgi:hypothetical protein